MLVDSFVWHRLKYETNQKSIWQLFHNFAGHSESDFLVPYRRTEMSTDGNNNGPKIRDVQSTFLKSRKSVFGPLRLFSCSNQPKVTNRRDIQSKGFERHLRVLGTGFQNVTALNYHTVAIRRAEFSSWALDFPQRQIYFL